MTSVCQMIEKKGGLNNGRVGGRSSGSLSDSATEFKNSSKSTSSKLSSNSSSVDTNKAKEQSSSTPGLVGWPLPKPPLSLCMKNEEEKNLKKLSCKVSEMEMMKERFAKLLLGEDMSGSGRGVCPALALSNSITNLCATIFGQLWKLEPLPSEKKLMWQREMEFLLSVSDHIVELIPSVQTYPDGSKLEVMTSRPRSDLLIHLPALRKLDNILLEILDSFVETEFWYIDQGLMTPEFDGSASFRRSAQRQEEKWWLPVPRVPPPGLSEDTRKKLAHKRECAAQILKAAMAINSITLADMEVPESYIENLPKNGKTCLGDIIYRYITSEQFSSECLLDCLDLSSEHFALEIANRVEASIYTWRRRIHNRAQLNPSRSTAKSSWEIVKDLMIDGGDKRELLAERAENLLLCLKQRFPGLTQTTLDASKIQCNKDIGKSILESYSRVLESLAFNIVARIDDLLYVDDLTKHSDSLLSSSSRSIITQKKVKIPYSVSVSGTPYKTGLTTPNLSPAPMAPPQPPLTSPRKGERTPFLSCNSSKNTRRGLGVRRVLTNYLAGGGGSGGEVKVKNCGNVFEGLGSIANRNAEVVSTCENSLEVVGVKNKELLSSWK